MYTHTHARTHARTHAHTHTHTHTLARTHGCTHTHTNTHSHSPLSSAEVLQSSSGGLQCVVVLALGEQRQVEPHHLRLVQQLKACKQKWRHTVSNAQQCALCP